MNLTASSNRRLGQSVRHASSGRPRLVKVMAQQQVNKGFSLLEWSSKLVPQGALVTGKQTPGYCPLRSFRVVLCMVLSRSRPRSMRDSLPAQLFGRSASPEQQIEAACS
eukprot:GHUV01030058.1.p1 GENE.GHUV01030058.1~~GHUV01030058.1.p1  ORF type:complete len:109 (-),score=11.52 GHUV01030058.1:488-814(-)